MDKLGLQHQIGRSDRMKLRRQPRMADTPVPEIHNVDTQVTEGSNNVICMLKEKLGWGGTVRTLGKMTGLE